MNGIEVKAKARITVRASNIARLVGGAGEETIIARVGEGIVSTIGSSKHHTEVLENPDNISKTVFSKGLIQVLHLKFYQLILLTLILVKILVQTYKLNKHQQTKILHKQKLKNVELWL